MTLAVRHMGIRDRGAIADALDVLRPDWTPARGLERHDAATAFVSDTRSWCYVAYDDDAPVGFAWGHEMPRPDGRRQALLYELEVAADHRRRGVGSLLVEAVWARARRRGCSRLWLVADAENEVALAFYASVGGQRSATADTVISWEL